MVLSGSRLSDRLSSTLSALSGLFSCADGRGGRCEVQALGSELDQSPMPSQVTSTKVPPLVPLALHFNLLCIAWRAHLFSTLRSVLLVYPVVFHPRVMFKREVTNSFSTIFFLSESRLLSVSQNLCIYPLKLNLKFSKSSFDFLGQHYPQCDSKVLKSKTWEFSYL